MHPPDMANAPNQKTITDMLFVTIFLWVLYSISEAYEDSQYTVILNHKPTVYPRILHGMMAMWLWCSWHVSSLVDCAVFSLLLITIFWFVFELSGNLFRGNYFYYIGTTASSDKWFKKYELPIFWLRIWLMGLAFALYYRDLLNIY